MSEIFIILFFLVLVIPITYVYGRALLALLIEAPHIFFFFLFLTILFNQCDDDDYYDYEYDEHIYRQP